MASKGEISKYSELLRKLNPKTDLPGLMAGGSAVYAVASGIVHHTAVSDDTIVAAVAFAASVVTYFRSTPVSDPRNAAGIALVPANAVVPAAQPAPVPAAQPAQPLIVPPPADGGGKAGV